MKMTFPLLKPLAGLAMLAGLATASCADGATGPITPDNLMRALDHAKGGETLVLGAGDYRDISLEHRHFSPALVIDAHAATIHALQMRDVSGLRILGGAFRLGVPKINAETGEPRYPPTINGEKVNDIEIRDIQSEGPGHVEPNGDKVYGEGAGVKINVGSKISVVNGDFKGFKVGIVLSEVDDFHLDGNTFSIMRSDGIDVALSHKGLIENNHCASTMIRDKEHPDCIQAWSRPNVAPTSDLLIRKNKVSGGTQGISLFNHTRQGVNDGGFDRITIEDNDLTVGYPDGISIAEGRSSVVRNNRVRTSPGARWRASINLTGDVKRCGNVVEPGAGKPGNTDPGC